MQNSVCGSKTVFCGVRQLAITLLALLMISVLILSGCAAPQILAPEIGRLAAVAMRQRQSALSLQTAPASGNSARAALTVAEANRLLVMGVDGNVYTIDPDGKNAFGLTNDASAEILYAQPTWSASGAKIAWSQVLIEGERVRSKLFTSRFDGSQINELEVAYPPFYIAWSPADDRLAYLSTWISSGQQSMALRLVKLDQAGNQDTTLALGAPFYFSWSPDGAQLLSHISNERVEIQSVLAKGVTFDVTPGFFPAPQWTPDGESLIYAVMDTPAASQRLVQADSRGEEIATLLEFEGRISFSISPDGSQLAFVESDPLVAMNALGALLVLNLLTGEITPISNEQVVAFFWSPDSEKIAYMEVEELNHNLGTRWHLWQNGKQRSLAFFTPSALFLNSYLPYFDQYSRSMTLWSPDSSAFTYAGASENKIAGVWVQTINDDTAPQYAANGVFASWSPR